ncbi:transcriptional regulator [Halorubellus sp. JP-L1]|uniref:DUF7527 domain-containing protein n=1 Tax=Halorubellus sp. JP-L1 TaxID=2715753 RepID=UPI00140B8FA6|nr:transcriptional regulator [Halorubellus sp. JP-L1]NHN40224.1 transcriptional regulator [Halorubellus sp. JP-L1]
MDSRTEERVKDWESRPFSSGYEDLRELADAEFSGAVETGSTTAFVLNGKVVGVVGGDVESFEGASGTIYEAPHPSLPLLFAMREQGGEERAKYYTNDTPISEADETLSSGSFTGYVELSENVLSGDYYVVYYGGRSMSCAFVGNSEQLVTDDDAFDRANDEVGIYTVWDVDIEVQDVPPAEDEPEDDSQDDAAGSGAGGAAVGASGSAADAAGGADVGVPDAEDDSDAGVDAVSADSSPTPGTGGATASDATVGSDATAGAADDDGAVAAPPVDDAEDSPGAVDEAEPDRQGESQRNARGTDPERRRSGGRRDDRGAGGRDGADAGQGDRERVSADAGQGDRERAGADAGQGVDDATRRHADEPQGGRDGGDGEAGGAMAEVPDEVMAEVEDEAQTSEIDDEAAWRETTTIPSINPERSTDDDDDDPLSASAASPSSSRTQGGRDASGREPTGSNGGRSRNRSSGAERTESRQRSGAPASTGGPSGAAPERVSELESELEDVRGERDAVASERDDLERERDELRERNRELEARVESLESEVADLEADLASAREHLEAEESPAAAASVELSPREALEGTNLFVRYGSKSATTLEDVHDTDVSVADLEANLRLEYHTGFDAADAAVDGQPYDEFLYDSTPYRFVEWFVYDLVFEIRDTGNESDLGDLYEAFPKVDRIELYGDVSLRYDEDGEEHREQTTFDVVVRDRMGNPLLVANVNDGRDPATESMMVDLQERASRVKRTSDALAGAFMVTASFFEPEALEIADEATSGSLLRRDSKKSYVKLSRKRGYHLCLVETRNGEFHVNVPEL